MTSNTNADRYRTVEYQKGGKTVTVFQDTRNHRAWIESTLTVPVTP